MRQIRLLSRNDEMKEAETSGTQPTTVAGTFSAGTSHPTGSLPDSFQQDPQLAFPDYQSATPANQNTPLPAPVPATVRSIAQTAPGVTRPGGRFVIIHADKKLKKTVPQADAPVRHLKPRLRQIILLVTVVVVFAGTLATLVPLSAGQSGFSLFSDLSTLIKSSQSNLQVQALQTQTAAAGQGVPQLNISHSQYVAIAEADATSVGISPTYFVRQIQQESGFNPNAESPGGAVGIAQFEPSTAAGLGINPWDPIQALQGAAKMMANLYHQYGDYAKALAAYNAGSANLNRAISSCGASWLSCMPTQTQDYIAIIMG